MYEQTKQSKAKLLLAFTLVAAMAATTRAEEPLRLYGPLGLSPAIQEAAAVFSARNGVQIKVEISPLAAWRSGATDSVDILYSPGEFIVSDVVRNGPAFVDENSLTPLYVRPAAILVRSENPKDIRDFPDLLRPGTRVMVVNGSGQTGLWENMTGQLQSLQNLVALQKNIVLCATSPDEALRSWRQREDIDAWLNWNVWHMPRRDSATLIPISDEYQIYRKCSISLTARTKDNSAARQFVGFVASAEGANVFKSWGWGLPPADATPAIVDRDISVACRIQYDAWSNDIGKGLASLRDLVDDYRVLGVPPEHIHVSAILDGDAGYWMLNDQAYSAYQPRSQENPNRQIVEELLAAGVSFELSAETMEQNRWNEKDILPGVRIVSGAKRRIATLAQRGYDYLQF